MHGEVIETYHGGYPFPSCLIFSLERTPLHVVASHDNALQTVYIITAYIPDAAHFESDLKARRKSL